MNYAYLIELGISKKNSGRLISLETYLWTRCLVATRCVFPLKGDSFLPNGRTYFRFLIGVVEVPRPLVCFALSPGSYLLKFRRNVIPSLLGFEGSRKGQRAKRKAVLAQNEENVHKNRFVDRVQNSFARVSCGLHSLKKTMINCVAQWDLKMFQFFRQKTINL